MADLPHWPRYRPIRVIGQGGFGTVYLCTDTEPSSPRYKQRVAVKAVSLSALSDEEALLVMSEVSLLKNLVHPNIIAYYDSFLYDEVEETVSSSSSSQQQRVPHDTGGAGAFHAQWLCLVTEYMDGGDLASLIRQYSGHQGLDSTTGGGQAHGATTTASNAAFASISASSSFSSSSVGERCNDSEVAGEKSLYRWTCKSGVWKKRAALAAADGETAQNPSLPSSSSALLKRPRPDSSAGRREGSAGPCNGADRGADDWASRSRLHRERLATTLRAAPRPPAYANGTGATWMSDASGAAMPTTPLGATELGHSAAAGGDAHRLSTAGSRPLHTSTTEASVPTEPQLPSQPNQLWVESFLITDIAKQCLDALAYLHALCIVHRDIKPSNIYLSKRDGTVKLGDFGVSKLLQPATPFATTFVGTPFYLCPELCMGDPYSFGADVWALGVLLYELYCLKLPFTSDNVLAQIYVITEGTYDTVALRTPHAFAEAQRNVLAQLYGSNFAESEQLLHSLVVGLVTQMLHTNPAERPSAETLLSTMFGTGSQAGSSAGLQTSMLTVASAAAPTPMHRPPSAGLVAAGDSSADAPGNGRLGPAAAAQHAVWAGSLVVAASNALLSQPVKPTHGASAPPSSHSPSGPGSAQRRRGENSSNGLHDEAPSTSLAARVRTGVSDLLGAMPSGPRERLGSRAAAEAQEEKEELSPACTRVASDVLDAASGADAGPPGDALDHPIGADTRSELTALVENIPWLKNAAVFSAIPLSAGCDDVMLVERANRGSASGSGGSPSASGRRGDSEGRAGASSSALATTRADPVPPAGHPRRSASGFGGEAAPFAAVDASAAALPGPPVRYSGVVSRSSSRSGAEAGDVVRLGNGPAMSDNGADPGRWAVVVHATSSTAAADGVQEQPPLQRRVSTGCAALAGSASSARTAAEAPLSSVTGTRRQRVSVTALSASALAASGSQLVQNNSTSSNGSASVGHDSGDGGRVASKLSSYSSSQAGATKKDSTIAEGHTNGPSTPTSRATRASTAANQRGQGAGSPPPAHTSAGLATESRLRPVSTAAAAAAARGGPTPGAGASQAGAVFIVAAAEASAAPRTPKARSPGRIEGYSTTELESLLRAKLLAHYQRRQQQLRARRVERAGEEAIKAAARAKMKTVYDETFASRLGKASPEARGLTEMPQARAPTKVPEARGLTEMPQARAPTKVPEARGLTEMPEARGLTEMPEARGLTEMPEARGLTEMPEARGLTEVPQATGITAASPTAPSRVLTAAATSLGKPAPKPAPKQGSIDHPPGLPGDDASDALSHDTVTLTSPVRTSTLRQPPPVADHTADSSPTVAVRVSMSTPQLAMPSPALSNLRTSLLFSLEETTWQARLEEPVMRTLSAGFSNSNSPFAAAALPPNPWAERMISPVTSLQFDDVDWLTATPAARRVRDAAELAAAVVEQGEALRSGTGPARIHVAPPWRPPHDSRDVPGLWETSSAEEDDEPTARGSLGLAAPAEVREELRWRWSAPPSELADTSSSSASEAANTDTVSPMPMFISPTVAPPLPSSRSPPAQQHKNKRRISTAEDTTKSKSAAGHALERHRRRRHHKRRHKARHGTPDEAVDSKADSGSEGAAAGSAATAEASAQRGGEGQPAAVPVAPQPPAPLPEPASAPSPTPVAAITSGPLFWSSQRRRRSVVVVSPSSRGASPAQQALTAPPPPSLCLTASGSAGSNVSAVTSGTAQPHLAGGSNSINGTQHSATGTGGTAPGSETPTFSPAASDDGWAGVVGYRYSGSDLGSASESSGDRSSTGSGGSGSDYSSDDWGEDGDAASVSTGSSCSSCSYTSSSSDTGNNGSEQSSSPSDTLSYSFDSCDEAGALGKPGGDTAGSGAASGRRRRGGAGHGDGSGKEEDMSYAYVVQLDAVTGKRFLDYVCPVTVEVTGALPAGCRVVATKAFATESLKPAAVHDTPHGAGALATITDPHRSPRGLGEIQGSWFGSTSSLMDAADGEDMEPHVRRHPSTPLAPVSHRGGSGFTSTPPASPALYSASAGGGHASAALQISGRSVPLGAMAHDGHQRRTAESRTAAPFSATSPGVPVDRDTTGDATRLAEDGMGWRVAVPELPSRPTPCNTSSGRQLTVPPYIHLPLTIALRPLRQRTRLVGLLWRLWVALQVGDEALRRVLLDRDRGTASSPSLAQPATTFAQAFGDWATGTQSSPDTAAGAAAAESLLKTSSSGSGSRSDTDGTSTASSLATTLLTQPPSRRWDLYYVDSRSLCAVRLRTDVDWAVVRRKVAEMATMLPFIRLYLVLETAERVKKTEAS